MKQCPYCAEQVQDEAQKCKHCGEWFVNSKMPNKVSSQTAGYFATVTESLPIRLDNLCLYKEGFTYSNKNYSYDEIYSINFSYSTTATRYVGARIQTSSIILFVVYTNIPQVPSISFSEIIVSAFAQAEKAKAIAKVYEVLRVLTINSRYSHYVSQLRNEGYIKLPLTDYKFGLLNKSTSNDAHVFINRNGTIKMGDKIVNLKIAKQNGGLLLGNSKGKELTLGDVLSSSIKRNPYEFAVSEKSLRWFAVVKDKLIFQVQSDTDVIAHIINELAEGKEVVKNKEPTNLINREEYLVALTQYVPDWKEIRVDPQFSVFLDGFDINSNKSRLDILKEADSAYDVVRVAAIYNAFIKTLAP